MQALKFKVAIDETHTLSLVLPAGVYPETADVIVLLEEPASKRSISTDDPLSDEEFEELLRIGDGQRLDGLSIKELVAEGRR